MIPYQAQGWPDMGGRRSHQARLSEQYACALIVIQGHFENVTWKDAGGRRQEPGQQITSH